LSILSDKYRLELLESRVLRNTMGYKEDKYRLELLENRVLRNTVGYKEDKVTRG
jgi:hypothetical protein